MSSTSTTATDGYGQGSYEEIKALVAAGVLGPELCPEPSFWHWPVLQPEHLPPHLKTDFEYYGEVRFY